ncbi:hypothetical protein A2V94_07180 [Candidatus Atribacteria bacterium RBG_16_35_8]|nr:MAG: hypothetical protein A2V94_07180 [Candidatus Atribacteria bacterium RBG_16_35_8]
MKCPYCGNHLLQKKGELVKARFKGRIEFINDMCHTQCYWCGKPIELYFPLSEEILNKASEVKEESFIIRKRG